MTDKSKLHFAHEELEGVLLAQPEGRLDNNLAQTFDVQLSQLTELAKKRRNHVVIDLSAVPYICTVILKSIRRQKLELEKEGLNVALCNATPVVQEVLNIVKFDLVAKMHETLDDAVSAVNVV